MQPIRTGRAIRAGVAALVTVLVAPQARASIVATQSYTVTLDTGLRGFVADFPTQTLGPNGAFAGSNVSDTSNRTTVPAFDQRYGAFQNMGGIVAFYGYPFEATFSVEGATDNTGDKVIAHEDVAGTIQMFVNGSSVASTPFSVSLNPSCTASSNSFTVILCSDQQKQAYFSESLPVAIHSGDTINFQYSMSETNISCEVLPVGGGSPGVCIQGNTGITDLNNIKDPEWGGTLAVTFDYVPEPASLSLLGMGLAGLIGARRKRRTA
jgi:hypothetical protein